MKAAIPWGKLVNVVEQFYPKEGGPGRPVRPLIWMLKVYFLQIWYRLLDPEAEDIMPLATPNLRNLSRHSCCPLGCHCWLVQQYYK